MRTRFGLTFAALAATASVIVVGAASRQDQSSPTGGVPTFTKDVAPILYKNCTSCHRPGEIAPMSLLTYEDARPRAKAIRDEISEGAMPPWHADPKIGHFSNERHLTDTERSILLRWAAGGAPKGDPKDQPPIPRYTDGWTIGEPDLVLPLPQEYKVPADGFVE